MALTLAFYRRNYIEGLFLSSGIVKSSNHTMEQMIEVARMLRRDHGFRGYIHLKAIPEADAGLLSEAGLWADRISINVELPTDQGLTRFAPDKNASSIRQSMQGISSEIVEAKDASKRFRHAPRFAPAGQSTQMIVGADGASDADIIHRANRLYGDFRLRRVYYSAFSPIPDASAVLPLKRPPLMREHRLYQSDWLMRFYGYSADELRTVAGQDGMLPLDMDPKLAWAIAFRGLFPMDVNRASRDELLRVPGLGTRAVANILQARAQQRLRIGDVARLTQSITKVRPFISAADWTPGHLLDREHIALPPGRAPAEQLELFG